MRYLLLPMLTIMLLWYGSDMLLQQQADNKIKDQQEKQQSISGGMVLKADKQGHFRGVVLINNIPMPFMIDTGATRTVIPKNLAIAAKLPIGNISVSQTAGGKIYSNETVLTKVVLGNAIITMVDASINEHLNEVLIGMNILKYFKMVKSNTTLSLVSLGDT